jgi:hypothetical protein
MAVYWKAYVAGFFSALLFVSCATAYAATVWPEEWSPQGESYQVRQYVMKSNSDGRAYAHDVLFYANGSVSYLDGRPVLILVGLKPDACSPVYFDVGVWAGQNLKPYAEWGEPDWKLLSDGLC